MGVKFYIFCGFSSFSRNFVPMKSFKTTKLAKLNTEVEILFFVIFDQSMISIPISHISTNSNKIRVSATFS